ncbi:MAG: TIGR02221 family CRISPR-associated protein [Clostridiales Family XIII bacterium]|jgi:CRISPR-associated Csx2 family protein|nr:TIGR02221 family CRISPR-associated protein [Clostridiales Family XIII bacterium]
MAKILIASMGTGSYNRATKEKSYSPAKYYIEGNRADFIESAYIYDALKHFHGIDKLILVGTCGSAWHLLYEHLFEADSSIAPVAEHSDDYFFKLLEISESPDKPHVATMRAELAPLKAAMGEFCAEIVVLEYGLNSDEILKNFELLSAASTVINDGDRIYFDITHSFRSLAFYELLAVSHIRDALKRTVEIEFVSYGMFEIARENGGLTPIVNLSPVISLLDRIKAAEEYNRYGTAYLLAELSEKNALGCNIGKEERKALRRLGDTISGNDLIEFKNLIKNCVNITKAAKDGRGGGTDSAIQYIFRDLAARFGDKIEDDTLLCTELAKWHFEHKRYLASAITLTECILDYCARLLVLNRRSTAWHWERDEKPFRAKLSNKSSNDVVSDFLAQYTKLNAIRNDLAHGRRMTEGMKSDLGRHAKGFYTMIENQFYKKRENEADLIKALQY